MPQDFESVGKKNISNTQTIAGATTIVTSDSDDAIIGINAANTGSSQILVSVLITDASDTEGNTFFIVKDAPVPVGSSLQIIDGGSKIVLQNGDVLKAYADTASSCDVFTSIVDSIST